VVTNGTQSRSTGGEMGKTMTRRGARILAVALSTFVALGSTALEAGAADSPDLGPTKREMADDLAGLGVPVKVKCPAANNDTKRLTCTARIEGQTVHFDVRIKQIKQAGSTGSAVGWRRVEAVLPIDEVKESVENEYPVTHPDEEITPGSAIKANCGQPADRAILVAKVGSSLKCAIKVDGVKVGTTTVRIVKGDGWTLSD
jgi:hypothetical protein